MGRKRKQEAIEQGSVLTIYKYFLAPLVKYKPEAVTLKEWWEYVFSAKERDITRYEARIAFNMPGLLYVAPNVKVQGIGTRYVRPGYELYVRRDTARPDVIDVELSGGHGRPEQQFCLTAAEWDSIERFVREAERERKEK